MKLGSYLLPEPKYAKLALEYPNSFRIFIGQAPEGTIARTVADKLSEGTPSEHHEALKDLWDNTIVPFAQKASAKALNSDLAKAMCTPLTHIAPPAKPAPPTPPVGHGYISDNGFVFDGEETPPELSSESEAVSTDSDSDSDSESDFEIIPPHKTRTRKNQKIVCWPMCAKKNAEKDAKFKPENKQALIHRYQLQEIETEVLALM